MKKTSTPAPATKPKKEAVVRHFRAIKEDSALSIQSSTDGHNWTSAIAGLDKTYVQNTFAHMSPNAKIVNTSDFKFTKK